MHEDICKEVISSVIQGQVATGMLFWWLSISIHVTRTMCICMVGAYMCVKKKRWRRSRNFDVLEVYVNILFATVGQQTSATRMNAYNSDIRLPLHIPDDCSGLFRGESLNPDHLWITALFSNPLCKAATRSTDRLRPTIWTYAWVAEQMDTLHSLEGVNTLLHTRFFPLKS